jgi:hypothetical protein
MRLGGATSFEDDDNNIFTRSYCRIKLQIVKFWNEDILRLVTDFARWLFFTGTKMPENTGVMNENGGTKCYYSNQFQNEFTK